MKKDALQNRHGYKSLARIPHRYKVSQAAACDGILYQVGPEDDNTNPGPGVLPI